MTYSDSGVAAFGLFCGLAIHLTWQYRPLFAALKHRRTSPPRTRFPRVQVVLCVRGRDPYLRRCIACLASQNYPNYRVTVVVDSEFDEALEEAIAASRPWGSERISVNIREGSSETCTRKLASLSWALQQIGEDIEIVAQCDGDAVVHPGWLTDLVNGLDDVTVAAVSGNRWYAPDRGGVAALSRYYWNAMAIPSMYQFGIPWAGCFAMKQSLFRDPKYIEFLRNSFSEDTASATYMRSSGLVFKTLPTLLIINEENVSIRSFWGFLVRQMLAVRLQHPDWRFLVTHAVLIASALWLARLLCALSSETALIGWFGGLAVFGTTIVVTVARYETALRRTLGSTNGSLRRPFGLKRFMMALPGLACTAWIYPMAIFAAHFAKRHEWRGILYSVGSKGVRVLSEAAYVMDQRDIGSPAFGAPSALVPSPLALDVS